MLVSALGAQSFAFEDRMMGMYGPIVMRTFLQETAYGWRLTFRDGTIMSYGWRKGTRDGKDYLIPFQDWGLTPHVLFPAPWLPREPAAF